MINTENTLFTFKINDRTAENLAKNLQAPWAGEEYHTLIKEHSQKLVVAGFTGALYNSQCGKSTFWKSPDGETTLRVCEGAILY